MKLALHADHDRRAYCMIHYIKYKITECGIMKRLIIFVIIGNLLYNFWGTFKADISVYEAVLLVLSDKLMLATAFTLPVLLLVSNVFNFRRYELQIMLRLGSTKRWFWANVLSSSVLVLIYIVGLLSVFAAVGILHGMSFGNHWSKAASTQQLNPIGGFDYTGLPFIILVYKNVKPLTAMLMAIPLILFRFVFYLEIQALSSHLCRQRSIGQIITIVLNYFDVFFYNIFFDMRINILPHEQTIVTCIDGYRLPYLISLLYWILLLTGTMGVHFILVDDAAERMAINRLSELQ